jgi:hypothetical protein
VPGELQVLGQSGTPAADALDPEHDLTGVAELLGPALKLGVAAAVAATVRSPSNCPTRSNATA